MKKLLLIIAFFLLLFTGTSVQAASGCCKIIKETAVYEIQASEVVYMTMQSEDCEKQKGPNTEVSFEEGKEANADGQSCKDTSGTTGESQPSKPIAPELQVSLPGFEKFSDVTCDDPEVVCEIPWIAEYIKAFYDYGLGVIGILSVIVMMIGGIIRITAGGNNAQISHGNQYIKGSVLGIIFAFCSYSILFLLNPNLTILKPINVSYLENEPLGEVEYDSLISHTPGQTDTSGCPSGVTGLNNLITYYTKNIQWKYSQAVRGTCSGANCFCDCSWFSQELGQCAGLRTRGSEGTSASLIGDPNKVKITQRDCDNSPLAPGDIIVWRSNSPTICPYKNGHGGPPCGHVLTYIDNNKMIECGGGSHSGSVLEDFGAIKITDWKKRCSNYLLKRGAYYIKR